MIKHFADLDRLSEDPILGLQTLFNEDKRANKINLSIGVYKDEEGKMTLLDSVREAEKKIISKPKTYLPIDGDSEFNRLFSEFIFEDNPFLKSDRYLTIETLGATGALSIMSSLLKLQGFKKIAIPSPSWPNHELIFGRSGLQSLEIPYYNRTTNEIDEKNFIHALQNLDSDTALLMQVSCHNPTGKDPEKQLWKQLSEIARQKRLFVLFDLAYHGFKHSLKEDLYPINLFIETGLEFAFAYSFSKNMGLYGDRVGALTVVAENQNAKLNALSQIKRVIRGSYSTPPIHGCEIVKTIFKDKALRSHWESELKAMKDRMTQMKNQFKQLLTKKNISTDAFENTYGLFLLLDLSREQVLKLRDDFSIYLPEDGRINIAALTNNNLEIVSQAYQAIKG